MGLNKTKESLLILLLLDELELFATAVLVDGLVFIVVALLLLCKILPPKMLIMLDELLELLPFVVDEFVVFEFLLELVLLVEFVVFVLFVVFELFVLFVLFVEFVVLGLKSTSNSILMRINPRDFIRSPVNDNQVPPIVEFIVMVVSNSGRISETSAIGCT